jgi:complement component 1 Q subcomponent-binding protein
LEDELKHEKASGLEDLDSSVQNIQYVLQNNSWEVRTYSPAPSIAKLN